MYKICKKILIRVLLAYFFKLISGLINTGNSLNCYADNEMKLIENKTNYNSLIKHKEKRSFEFEECKYCLV